MLDRYAEIVGAMLTVLAPLVGAPLTVLAFYLRTLKEQLRGAQAELLRRMESLEHTTGELRKEWRIAERDFATKEEWLREVLQARRRLDELTAMTVRLQVCMDMGLPSVGAVVSREKIESGAADKEAVHHGERTNGARNQARAQ